MLKKTLLILLAITCLTNASAHVKADYPRFTFGAEWGYVATIQSGHHHNFFSPDGFRVDDRGNVFKYHSNADVYIHAGYNFNSNWNLSLYIGYAGVDDLQKVMPLSLRATHYFGIDPEADRWFAFWDIGSGICFKKKPQEIVAGKIGGGYRISLSRNTKLDFLASVRMTYTHPQVYFDGIPIDMQWVNRNNAYVGAISFGIGLTF